MKKNGPPLRLELPSSHYGSKRSGDAVIFLSRGLASRPELIVFLRQELKHLLRAGTYRMEAGSEGLVGMDRKSPKAHKVFPIVETGGEAKDPIVRVVVEKTRRKFVVTFASVT